MHKTFAAQISLAVARTRTAIQLGSVLLLGMLTGCAPQSGPAQFFRLQPSALQPTQFEPTDASSRVIGLGPVKIPGYLDRPQIVTGGPGDQLLLDEYMRWAEPLRDNITQVLSENLSTQLRQDHILPFPWNRALNPAYQVDIDIARFHVNEARDCELWANWSIIHRGKAVALRKSRIVLPAAGDGYPSMVATQNQALAEFSGEIARALNDLPKE